MYRSIFFAITSLLILTVFTGAAMGQDIILRSSDASVVQLSKDTEIIQNVFDDRNGDGVPDALTLDGEYITANIRIGDAQGFKFEDERYVVLYPAEQMGLPVPGTKNILGFVHYFDADNISTYLAIMAEQAPTDDTTNGLAIFFYDAAGLRVGAPTAIFMEKARLRAIPIYQEWVAQGLDFGIGTNQVNSQFFVYAKDLGLTDHILIVMFQLYQ